MHELLLSTSKVKNSKKIKSKTDMYFSRITFPGESCFPLSPVEKTRDGENEATVSKKD
jgi:hypothetical protein